jgi:hypothetical protein
MNSNWMRHQSGNLQPIPRSYRTQETLEQQHSAESPVRLPTMLEEECQKTALLGEKEETHPFNRTILLGRYSFLTDDSPRRSRKEGQHVCLHGLSFDVIELRPLSQPLLLQVLTGKLRQYSLGKYCKRAPGVG